MTQFFSTPEQGQKLKKLGIQTKYHWHKDKNGWHLHDLPMTDENDVPAMTAEDALEVLEGIADCEYKSGRFICGIFYAPTLAQACVDMLIKVKG